MFCRNCGKELTGAQEVCSDCGTRPTAGASFCTDCGAPTMPLTEICGKCGVSLAKAAKKKTWKTRTAGTLAIITGAVTVVECVFAAVLVIPKLGWWGTISALTQSGIVAVALALVIIGAIVAIVGGVFALKRKLWGLALAGCICALFSLILIPVFLNVPLAIAAIVLVVLGKGEFE